MLCDLHTNELFSMNGVGDGGGEINASAKGQRAGWPWHKPFAIGKSSTS